MDKKDILNFQSVTRPRKLSEQVEKQLLTSIHKSVFSPGEYLPGEHKLAELFQVSRGVIREALLMLSAKGIIEMRKGKGAIILQPKIDSFYDIFSVMVNYKCGNQSLKYIQAVRTLIEPPISALSAEFRNNKDLSALEACIENMEKQKEDKSLLAQCDIEFHKIITNSCNNPMFPIVLDPIYHVMKTYQKVTFEDAASNRETLKYHERIFNAIKHKNSDEAFNSMKEHLLIAEKDIIKLYSKSES
ncbi:FCD domain-containing protein [candidate division KSB1 bacterium]|nr:FCD domain-containing protein [candidate division KSB1 bacterium]